MEHHLLHFKLADVSDIPLIRRLAESTFPNTYREILSQEQIDYMMELMYSTQSLTKQMKEDRHFFFLASNESETIGYVSIQASSPGDIYQLQKLYVLPQHHGKGFGSQLFSHAIAFASLCGAQHVELNVNRHNHRAYHFYLQHGMKVKSSGDFYIGKDFYMNDYIMTT